MQAAELNLTQRKPQHTRTFPPSTRQYGLLVAIPKLARTLGSVGILACRRHVAAYPGDIAPHHSDGPVAFLPFTWSYRYPSRQPLESPALWIVA